jgi:hypothetical protein
MGGIADIVEPEFIKDNIPKCPRYDKSVHNRKYKEDFWMTIDCPLCDKVVSYPDYTRGRFLCNFDPTLDKWYGRFNWKRVHTHSYCVSGKYDLITAKRDTTHCTKRNSAAYALLSLLYLGLPYDVAWCIAAAAYWLL